MSNRHWDSYDVVIDDINALVKHTTGTALLVPSSLRRLSIINLKHLRLALASGCRHGVVEPPSPA